MLVIAYLFLIGGKTDAERGRNAILRREVAPHRERRGGSTAAQGRGRKGNSGGPVVASGTNAQRGGGAGPRAATMKSGKQPQRRRRIPRAMVTLAVVMITPL